MEYVKVKGAKIPAIGLGTWLLQGIEAQRITEKAIAAGYRHIDTARIYGNEEAIGKALEASGIDRHQLFITTKIWWEDLGPEKFNRSVENSLAGLRTPYVNLLLIHWPHPDLPVASYLERLMEAQAQGAATHIGVSNFTPELIDEAVATGANLVNNQVEYHPFLDQSAILNACHRHGFSLTAYAPLARGRVTRDKTIREIAQKHGKTPAQAALRWLIQQKDVIAVPKTSRPARLVENFDIFDFQLDNEDMQRINALKKQDERIIDPEHAPW
jgi:2,5-diketo-D-gluconate reductase B